MEFSQLIASVKEIDATLTSRAASAVNVGLNTRNWLVGAWIVEYEQKGNDRAEYGDGVLREMAQSLQIRGLSETNLKYCRQFYDAYGRIRQTVSDEFSKLLPLNKLEIRQTVSGEIETSPILQTPSAISEPPESPEISTPPEMILTRLSFSQIVELLKIDDPLKRTFYEIEAIKGTWSVRELKRQIGSLLFERTGLSTDKEKLIRLTNDKADKLQPIDIIRDPYVFEFTGLRPKEVIEESDLELALLDDLQAFLLELGHGFCFEERQKRIQIGSEYYFLDLVFYHRVLKCHVILDLKVRHFQHGDAGQLNTYVNYFRENEMTEGDQPPIGLLLCTDKDESLARYALGGMDENLFISRYQTALPEAEELQRFLTTEARRLGIGSDEPNKS